MAKACFVKLKETWRIDPYADPPLGMLSVISNAKNISYKGKPLEISLLDMAHETEIPKADIYGISACTLDFPELLSVANRIKQEHGGIVITGGPHFDAFSNDYWKKEIENLPIDIVCKGEGESTFSKAVSSLEDRTKKVIQQDTLLDLDTIKMPAWEFLDKEKYFGSGKAFSGIFTKGGNSTSMITSRGCPGACTFCASPTLHKRKVRFRSVENVEKEIDYLQENYNIKEIRFQDDCFALKLSRFRKMAEMLSEKGVIYRCSMRTDGISDEEYSLLKKSGCQEIGFGIESAEDYMLKEFLNKRTTVEQNKEALKRTKQEGIRTRAFIMTGLPGETKDSAKKMIDFLIETNPDVVTLTSFMPFPGCDIYENSSKYGLTIVDRDWGKYNLALNFKPGAPFVHRINTATTEEMERNREMLKEYIFTTEKSNVREWNKPYQAKK